MEIKPVAWSHSSLKKFLDCPKRYYEERVVKSVKDTPSEQSLWGDRVHKLIQAAIETKEIPEDEFASYIRPLTPFFETKGTLYTEQKLAITSSFKPTQWFASDVWCRVILDALWIDNDKALIVDWKSGKRRKDSNQLRLNALVLFAHYPEIDRINTAFVWLQGGAPDIEKFKREDIPVAWQEILPDVRRLEYAHRTQTFVPKPGPLCGWCPVQSCRFWVSKDGTRG